LSRTDLIFCGLHDAAVGCQLVPKVVRLEQEPLRLEAEERFLETRPFLFDDPPHEAGGENPLGHGGENAVVGDLRHRRVVGRRAKQR